MMCIQKGEGIDVGHLGNQQLHCPLEYQVHTSPSLASLVHHHIPSTYCCIWHMVSVKIFIELPVLYFPNSDDNVCNWKVYNFNSPVTMM